jgi:hypothetical protein
MLNCPELVNPHYVLYLPDALHAAYRDELSHRGLLEAAIAGSTEKHIHGGPTVEQTLEHFKFRFPNSASRVVCVIVDPHESFASIPIEILESFSSHRIAVLDVACGAGASLFALLSVICAARAHKLVPTLPLTIGVLAADISPTALELYSALSERLAPTLADQGLYLDVSTRTWDAAQADQTSALCDTWFQMHSDANEYFVLVGNLSGVGAQLAESFRRSFEHITERIANVESTMLWIEPAVKKGIIEKLGKILSAAWLKRTRAVPF